MPRSIQTCDFLSRKRARKRAMRIARRRKKALDRYRRYCDHLARFGSKSKIIDLLANACSVDVNEKLSQIVAKVPQTFSIIEDPARSVAWILHFAKHMRIDKVKRVEIDQSKLEIYDLAANSLLDIVAYESRKERRYRGSKIYIGGRYPLDPNIKRFVKSMGVIKHLNIVHEKATASESANLRLFDRRCRHYDPKQDPTKPDAKAKVVAGFVDHFNICLKDHNRVLTHSARHKLCEYISEILCNAEDHPGLVDWTVQGYLDNSLEVPVCEIAIFNFGKSIAETLSDLPDNSYTRTQIDPYIKLHAGQGFFGLGWRLPDLLTLVALQSHVSSKNNTVKDSRGQGSVDLIDFFQKVHRECAPESKVQAKMAIVSGGTYILFDGTYAMRETQNRGKVIAFNRMNDLNSKPDAQFVRSLKGVHFPGTIISIRFPLGAASTVALGDN
ncbi:hypothetical protein IP91_04086 [Pseudoduganella lurida]|uniref:Uncharacterized protein n=1 Tax=Pseudoduganella lurida TaxID=1036180 RepID=A0A562R0G6_9BURK|nr:hypothetical protein [Pseudoduganella lurida]TWI62565.1 hypothetical protein IP91_04086 [Pseudoduganella lurida]